MHRALIPILVLAALVSAGCGSSSQDTEDPWQTIELGTDADFRDIHFISADTGWMVGAVGIAVPGGIVARTRDGGLTWEYTTGAIPKRSRTHTVDFNAVHFVDELRGVAGAGAGTIMRTEDGGRNWMRVQPTGPIYAQNHAIDFVGLADGWICGRQGVLKTGDAGVTWKRIDEENGSSGNAEAWSIDMVDAERGWMVGKFGLVMRTDDGGATWEKVPALGSLEGLSGDEKPFLRSVHFVDREHGWAAGSWKEWDDSDPLNPRTTAWAVIIATRDGGKTWKKQAEGVVGHLTAIRFADEKRGWATGYDRNDGTSVIWATEDGGRNWKASKTVYGEELKAIEIRDGRVWVVGDRVRDEAQRLFRMVFTETENHFD